jgi:hypothetical protein
LTPFAARAFAMAAPMPLLAPVTTATFPKRLGQEPLFGIALAFKAISPLQF